MRIGTAEVEGADKFREIAREEFARLGITPTQYRSKKRNRSIAWARAEVAFLLRIRRDRPSFPVIAWCVGVSNHTSAMLMIRAHARRAAIALEDIPELPLSEAINIPIERKATHEQESQTDQGQERKEENGRATEGTASDEPRDRDRG